MLSGQDTTPEFKQAVALVSTVVDQAKSPAQKHIYASLMFRIMTDKESIRNLNEGEEALQKHLRGSVADRVVLTLTKLLAVGGIRFSNEGTRVKMYPIGKEFSSVSVPEDGFKSGEHLLAVSLQSVLRTLNVDYHVDYSPVVRKATINRDSMLGTNYPVGGDNYLRYLKLCNPTEEEQKVESIPVVYDQETKAVTPAEFETGKLYSLVGMIPLGALVRTCRQVLASGSVLEHTTVSPSEAETLNEGLSLMSIGPIQAEGAVLTIGEKADPMHPLVPGPECYSEFKRITEIMMSWYKLGTAHVNEALLEDPEHVTLYNAQDAKLTHSPHMVNMATKIAGPTFNHRTVSQTSYAPAVAAAPIPTDYDVSEYWKKLPGTEDVKDEAGLFTMEEPHYMHVYAVLRDGMEDSKRVFFETAPCLPPFTAAPGYSFVVQAKHGYPTGLKEAFTALNNSGVYSSKTDCIMDYLVRLMKAFDDKIKHVYVQTSRKYAAIPLSFKRDLLYSMALYKIVQQPRALQMGTGVRLVQDGEDGKLRIMAI